MDIKYELADLYKNELLKKYFNSTDEEEIIKKINECFLLKNNFILNIYNKINNFSRITNYSFSFSKDISISEIKELRDKLIKEIDSDLISFIVNYCQDNMITYATLDDILIVNNEIYSHGAHLFYNVFEIDKKIVANKKGNRI